MAGILIVDDDASVGAALIALFAQAGRQARWARDGTAAVALAERDPPDVLLLDLFLDDETTSLPLIALLRARRTVVLTATRLSAALRGEVLASGAEALVSKSIEPAELLRMVVP